MALIKGVIAIIVNAIISGYNFIIDPIPEQYIIFVNLFLYTLIIALYAIFVWKFYRFLARRDILSLDLRQYNRSSHPILSKVFAAGLFLLEYVIILPFLVFFWFSVLSLFLLLLSKEQSVDQILLIAAVIVAAIRFTAYYKEDLSKDLAKIFPFTVLAIFLLSPDFFNFIELLHRLEQIPLFLTNVVFYVAFIFVLEVIIRMVYTLIDLAISGKGMSLEEEDKKEEAEE